MMQEHLKVKVLGRLFPFFKKKYTVILFEILQHQEMKKVCK